MASILITALDGGGAVFPLVAVAHVLRERGHEVTLAAGQEWRLFARSNGVGFLSLHRPRQRELAVLLDELAARGTDPLSSCLLLLEQMSYVDLHGGVQRILGEGARWDCVLANAFEPAGPLAADAAGIPCVTYCLNPDIAVALRDAERGLPDAERILERSNAERGLLGLPADASLFREGAVATLVLVDPLLGDGGLAGARRVGYPYWDALPGWAPSSDLEAFVNRGGPLVVATLGTSVRNVAEAAFRDAVEGGFADAAGTLLLGPFHRRGTDVHVERYAPLSWLRSRRHGRCVLIHHGGIGTAHAQLLGAWPGVVVPQLFDQHAVGARLTANGFAAGTATNGCHRPLAAAVEEALGSPEWWARLERASAMVTPPSRAVLEIVETVESACATR